MYIVEIKRKASSEPEVKIVGDMNEAAREGHEFFMTYYTLKCNPETGSLEAFDKGNNKGWTCFEDVSYFVIDGETLVTAFTHVNGSSLRIMAG